MSQIGLNSQKNVDLNVMLMLSKNQQRALIQEFHCDPVQFLQTYPVSQISSCPLESGLRLLMAFQTHNFFFFFWQDWIFFFCFAWVFFRYGEWGLLFIVVHGFLIEVASSVVGHRF